MFVRQQTHWISKPPRTEGVNRRHPLANGLIGAFTFSDPLLPIENLVAPSSRYGFTGTPLTRFGSIGTPFSFDPGTRFGGGVRCTSVSAGQYVTLGIDSGQFPQSRVTILIGIKKMDGTNRPTHALHTGSGGTSLFELLVPFTDGTVYFDWGGGVSGSTRVSVGGLTKGDDVWAFTTGPRGMEIWQNGLKKASNSATPSRTSGASTPISIGEATLGADLAITSFVFFWDRQLLPSEIRSLSDQPYGMIGDDNEMIFVEGPADPDLSYTAIPGTSLTFGGSSSAQTFYVPGSPELMCPERS